MNSYVLFGGFLVSAIVIWVAGIWLSRTVDALDTHYKLGDAFGGLLLLGISTSLPEIAITISAAIHHRPDVVLGNLIGGIAIQTVVLALLDRATPDHRPLSFLAASLLIVLEAGVVMIVAATMIVGAHTPVVISGTGISLASVLILAFWVIGLALIYRARRGLPWKSEAIEAAPGRAHHERRAVINHAPLRKRPVATIWLIFALACVATLVAGVAIEQMGTGLALVVGISGGLFAATFMAAATALPEISTGVASVQLGDYQLAFSDIFGGNAFMPALFIVGDLFAGQAILQSATKTDLWFAALGILLTGIYVIGLIVRPRKSFFGLGLDSIAVVGIYVLGVTALAFAK